MANVPSTWRLWRLHLGLCLAIAICTSAFVIELWRALDGNALSWAYVFEWPLLLAYGVYMWHRLVLEERGLDRPRTTAPSAEDDAALEAFNQYLAALHAEDAAAEIERGAD